MIVSKTMPYITGGARVLLVPSLSLFFFLPQILSAPLCVVKAGKWHGEEYPLASNMGTLWVITNLKRLQKRALSNIPWYNNHFPWKICVIKTTNLKNTYAFWHPNIPLFCKTSLTFRIPVEVDLRGIMTDSFIFVRSSASTQGNSYIHNKVNLTAFALNSDKYRMSIISFYFFNTSTKWFGLDGRRKSDGRPRTNHGQYPQMPIVFR